MQHVMAARSFCSSASRLTGKEVVYTQKLQKFFGHGRAELQAAMDKLLPPTLLDKVGRRKLVRAGRGEEGMTGRPYKMQ